MRLMLVEQWLNWCDNYKGATADLCCFCFILCVRFLELSTQNTMHGFKLSLPNVILYLKNTDLVYIFGFLVFILVVVGLFCQYHS